MPNLPNLPERDRPEKAGKKNRFSRYSAYLYLAMALLIVGVATASILMLRRSTPDVPEFSIPEMSVGPVSVPEKHEEIPVYDEQSGIEDTSSEESAVTPEPAYVFPIPSGKIQKKYATDLLVFSETMKDYRVHNGIDITAPLGTPVSCYTDGIVESVKKDDFLGVSVTVRHSYGLVTVYRNLGETLANGILPGRSLKAGDTIGYVGKTAATEVSETPHLHFEMMVNGSYIDPEKEMGSTQ